MSKEPYDSLPSHSLVALKERRTQVVATLSHAFARDHLDVDELDRRLEAAHRALTVAELDALVRDVDPSAVPESKALQTVTVRSLSQPQPVRSALERPERQSMMAVMGGVERSGRWMVPARMSIQCLMGGVSLDFREADIAPGVTEVSVYCMMGGVEVIVPPHINVEVAGSAIMGGFDQAHPGTDVMSIEPVATLRITGVAFCGGVGVETRRVGESSRQARKRIKNERKLMLESGPRPGQAALPAAIVVPEKKRR